MTLTDEQIRERDGNRCARCGGSKGGLHIHHRWMRSAGENESACNRVTLCAYCHNFVHAHPSTSIDEGWLCGRYGDPAEIEVRHFMWPTWPVLLEDGGGITPVIDDE
jgi:hypothetical protein